MQEGWDKGCDDNGDHKLTALAIAKELKIFKDGDIALTGRELDSMSDEELERIVEKVTVYARVSPKDKMKIVKAPQEEGPRGRDDWRRGE